MPDKTALGISEELRQFIEALVEDVVFEGKPFEGHKKYLNRFCQTEGINYCMLDNNLSKFFETAEELKAHESKGSEGLLRLLGKECYLSDDEIEKIISVINNKRGKIEKERKAQQEAERKAKKEAERTSRIRKQRLIAALWTIIILVCLFGLCWWLFFSPNSDKVTDVNDLTAIIDSDVPSSLNTENETSQNDPIKAIDLGLPSGTKWANCNVGATKPWEYGGYYAWGELEEKTEYWDDNYAYYSSCLWGLYTTYHDIGTTICETKYDVAHVKWGEKWQMPMREQVLELMEICKREWTTLNGVEGCMFTGPNGNNIFLPAAGKRAFTELHTLGNYGNYWSGAQDLDSDGFAHSLDFSKEGGFWSRWPRYYGLSVRPVLTDNGTLVH